MLQVAVKICKYQLDYEKSKAVYEYCNDRLAVKQCYNNVFNVVTDYISKFRLGEWKVAYGYMTVFENVMCRHCFIIDENDKVIDPTIFTTTNICADREYISMKIFDDIDVYFNAIEQENYYPALDKHLRENVLQMQKWADKNGLILTG